MALISSQVKDYKSPPPLSTMDHGFDLKSKTINLLLHLSTMDHGFDLQSKTINLLLHLSTMDHGFDLKSKTINLLFDAFSA